jgi:hypothetical protein
VPSTPSRRRARRSPPACERSHPALFRLQDALSSFSAGGVAGLVKMVTPRIRRPEASSMQTPLRRTRTQLHCCGRASSQGVMSSPENCSRWGSTTSATRQEHDAAFWFPPGGSPEGPHATRVPEHRKPSAQRGSPLSFARSALWGSSICSLGVRSCAPGGVTSTKNELQLRRGPVVLGHLWGDASSLADLDALLLRPLTHGRRVMAVPAWAAVRGPTAPRARMPLLQ